MKTTIKGLDQMDAAFSMLQSDVRAAASEGIEAALHEIAAAWAARVPVLDGNYRAAMQQVNAVSMRKGKGPSTFGYVNVPHVRGVKTKEQPKLYARRLEFGDSDRRAEPSARPALDATKPRIAQLVGDSIKARVQ